MRVYLAVAALGLLLLPGPDVARAQSGRILEFFATEALPAGRAFAFAIVSGVPSGMAANWLYDKLQDSSKQTKPPPDATPGPSSPGSALAAPPVPLKHSDPPLDLSALRAVPCPKDGCLSLHQELLTLNGIGNPPPPPVDASPVIAPPPPPAPCTAQMPALAAMQRATAFDKGTLAWPRAAAAAEACYYVAAQHSVPLAQYCLADMLLTGDDGVAADRRAGLGWLEEAADNGVVPAQTRLAIDYETGSEAAPLDQSAAGFWYEQAAEAGDAYAQYQIARFYARGLGGLPVDLVTAFYWLDLALKQNLPNSLATMDMLLAQVRADQRAGNPGAMFVLGIAYQFGVPQRIAPDPRSAFLAYRDAAQSGFRSPRYNAMTALQQLCDAAPWACD
jgi:TPR repeat protein